MNYNNKKFMISIIAGSFLEWYDFSLFGSIASLLSMLFFPSGSSIISLLATLSIFSVGFIVRPIGGILIGHIGDRHGRKKAFSLTVMMMALSTVAIGILPTFSQVGYFSPGLLLLLRLTQGFAASGEYPGAICLLTELASSGRKGLMGSLSVFGVLSGITFGTVVCSLVSFTLSQQEILKWGWRIPFLIGAPLGLLSCYLRIFTKESPVFTAEKKAGNLESKPIVSLFKEIPGKVTLISILFSFSTITFYILIFYIGNYLISTGKSSIKLIFISNTISSLTLSFLVILFGYLSDFFNKKLMMIVGCIGVILFSFPLFALALKSGSQSLLALQIVLLIFIGLFVGPLAAFTAESFPAKIRYSGIAISLNIGAGILGGSAPLVAMFLVNRLKWDMAPCAYLVGWACICLITLFINQYQFGHQDETLRF